MPKCTAASVVKYLCDSVFPNNGCPKTIISDNGVQFTSNLFEQMCKAKGIEHHTTPRNHPQANPVEATNKTIKTAIKSHIFNDNDHSKWELSLNKVLYDINSTPHTSTNKSPHYLHFGRELVAHGNEYSNLIDINTDDNSGKIDIVLEEASNKMNESYDQRREKYNRTAKKRHFQDNAVVYIPRLKLSNKADKYAQKLAPAKVQCVIRKKVGNDVYEVVGMNGKFLGKIHADDISVHTMESVLGHSLKH